MNNVYLSLGSNLSDREAYLTKAIRLLPPAGLPIVRVSSFYETQPWGKTGIPAFLNCCVLGHTELSARELLKATQHIEQKSGRLKRPRWRSREIDIDILLLGDETIQFPDLLIPHPYLFKRRFYLVPLYEIIEDREKRIHGQTWSEIMAHLKDHSWVNVYDHS